MWFLVSLELLGSCQFLGDGASAVLICNEWEPRGSYCCSVDQLSMALHLWEQLGTFPSGDMAVVDAIGRNVFINVSFLSAAGFKLGFTVGGRDSELQRSTATGVDCKSWASSRWQGASCSSWLEGWEMHKSKALYTNSDLKRFDIWYKTESQTYLWSPGTFSWDRPAWKFKMLLLPSKHALEPSPNGSALLCEEI